MERQVHVVLENVLFLTDAFFKMVHGALVENTCSVQPPVELEDLKWLQYEFYTTDGERSF